jgi:AcrR family transcriptional regulator
MSPTVASAKRRDLRDAILDAALAVVHRDGYADANVDEIARTAGVAKPTIYNHFGDKANLFVETIRRGAARSNERISGVIDSIDVHPDDLRTELQRVGAALVGCLTDTEGVAVMHLQLAERPRFGELLDELRTTNRERTIDRLAGKLAQLSAAGRLRPSNPNLAARHLMALVSDDLLARSGFGAIRLRADEVAAPVSAGIDTFLAAFGTARPV